MNRIRLLLVEDNPGDADLVYEHLAEAHDAVYEVETAGRLSHALTLLHEHGYDIVLLDLTLPDSTGFATFTRVRECASRIPVVILTGMNDQSLALEALRRGAQDYLVKSSVDGPVINRVLQYALARHRLDDMKRDFISMVNHELRTPFTSIHLALQLLEGNAGVMENPDTARLVRTAHTNSTYLLQLVNNILDYERLERNGFSETAEPVDLVAAARRAIDATAILAAETGTTCVLNTEFGQATVGATADGMQQVMVNLLSNAVKYSPEHGTVTVSITRMGTDYRVAVADTGPGIPPELQDRIFGRFVRGQAVRKHMKGTGLGLAICKKILEGFGGTIDFVSEPGEGTTFFFHLPAAETAADRIAAGGNRAEAG